MAATPPPRVHRLATVGPEPWTVGSRYDYADAFEAQLAVPDGRSAEQWARCALEQAPRAVRVVIIFAQRALLRLQLEGHSDPQHVLGWRVVASEPDVISLAAHGPLVSAVIVGRRSAPTAVQIKTFVIFERRRGRFLWAAVAPLHRRIARLLLKRAAGRSGPFSSGSLPS